MIFVARRLGVVRRSSVAQKNFKQCLKKAKRLPLAIRHN
jgi:hypothetical protein